MSPTHSVQSSATVDAAITSRRSVRAYLPTPVPRQVVGDILRVASRAASGTNTQPWRVTVLGGEAKTALSAKIRAVFDDPVGLIFTIDRVLRQGSWLDYGMFLQNVMLAARGRGLDTCPQAAFMQFHRIIMAHIGAPDSEMLVCGMSLGHADPAAIANRLVTEREAVAGFTRFLG